MENRVSALEGRFDAMEATFEEIRAKMRGMARNVNRDRKIRPKPKIVPLSGKYVSRFFPSTAFSPLSGLFTPQGANVGFRVSLSDKLPLSVKKGEELLRVGIKAMLSGSDPTVVWVSRGASTRTFTKVIKPADLAFSIGHKGISRLLVESLLTSHLILLIVVKGKDGRKETSGLEVMQTVSETNYNTCAP
ncbi:hypothetical protein VIGAN_04143600 [Vigna angularis var. angularis]|uniref:Uncharacterized protein n=1 Tax=Vigna angularis var. angularis TaxID=157739 RepID=A0A0S3RU64_PHAAN|nr:hypothetical protein VIGAN_04143600 [Vigna angularis var. angularis]